MKVACRAVAICLVLAFVWMGPLAPFASAQQPVAPAPAPAQPSTQPQMFQEDVKPLPPREGMDIYDYGAIAATAAAFPPKAALCVLGSVAGFVAFAATFGARADAAAAIIDEGCGGKARWIVRGSDIRPRPNVTRAFDWENHRFEWEK
jgi:hypothetical protein